MDVKADQRIVDGAELCDRFIGTSEVALNQIRRSPQLSQRGGELRGRLLRLSEGPFVRLGPIVPGPEDGNFLGHAVKSWLVVKSGKSSVYCLLSACYGVPVAWFVSGLISAHLLDS